MSFLSSRLLLTPSIRFYSSTSSLFLKEFMTSQDKGPIQLSIESKISEALNPTILETINESQLHAHHEPMRGNTNKETHFSVTVVSDAFKGKTLMQRHRLIYGLLDDELQNKGVHALTLKTKTQEEIDRE
ncbi:bola-like protein-domain-containing protein [Cokeromyces recurvatus]|uniref:bola-like protein-domain-containing protein n=1 Tax=Cokeromyces recurvatus TaxID=90255 RepID=UPI0022211AF8|nr:bola-like protein-domain-containing protein [Cokeromyces recurvatus]KAI7905296.1 bola-like protein-domain-containing protein [Cokeromyces recurvatus]